MQKLRVIIGRMRALIISHASNRASNRQMYRLLADDGVEVSVAVPDKWKSGLGLVIPDPEPERPGLAC
jgi:hypothetical protein